jgi:hypothetical protein
MYDYAMLTHPKYLSKVTQHETTAMGIPTMHLEVHHEYYCCSGGASFWGVGIGFITNYRIPIVDLHRC